MLWATIGLIQCCDAVATSQTIIMSYSSSSCIEDTLQTILRLVREFEYMSMRMNILLRLNKRKECFLSLYPFIGITFIFWMFLFTNLFPVCKFSTYIQLAVMLHHYIASWNLILVFRFPIFVHSKSLLRQKKNSVNKTHSKNWRALNRNLVYY